MLLNSVDDYQPNNVTSLAIAGMAGLGKTALAQLIYHDPRITSAFPLKNWTCIGDYNEQHWSFTELFRKVVRDLVKRPRIDESTSLERIIDLVNKRLEGKKYLLVLDDVWTEKRHVWQELENHLTVGESGSRIVVTTRSKKTAGIIGGVRVHELQGLGEDDSWHLFTRMAFDQSKNPDGEFVRLGKDIVKKCLKVPLVIRVVGSLLYGESERNWLSFRDQNLAYIIENDDTVNNILKLSYHQLHSSLKSCFAYCAIFPKGFEIDKHLLLSLWMAQGYINGEYEGEEFFQILLQRCFFQDVNEREINQCTISFKIHDLLHDIAEQVAGKEVCKLVSGPFNIDKKVRHLSLVYGFRPQGVFNKTRIRTCLQLQENEGCMSSDMLLANIVIATKWSFLRSLNLGCLNADTLPESISGLLHLRYLNLAWSVNLKVLPNSITKLVNLQSLDLTGCTSLEELPRDICKLVDLSTLNIFGCIWMRYMPPNLNLMTKLHTLGRFVVGGTRSYGQSCFYGLEVLRDLNNLKGLLEIYIDVSKNVRYVKQNYGEGAYLINKAQLDYISIRFSNEMDESNGNGMLLEDMQPHENIKELELGGYYGEKMPRWPKREDNSTLFHFPNLVKLTLSYSDRLQFLSSLEKLPRLKTLVLRGLLNLEYMINVNLEECILSEGSSFFSCLEYLELNDLPRLKGWWSGSGERYKKPISKAIPCFGQLRDLLIARSPMLKSIPICSRLRYVWQDDPKMSLNIVNPPSSYKSLVPTEGKSRMIDICYLHDNFSEYMARH